MICHWSAGVLLAAEPCCRAGKGPTASDSGEYTGSGDVKYHLGTSYDRPTISGKQVRHTACTPRVALRACAGPVLCNVAFAAARQNGRVAMLYVCQRTDTCCCGLEPASTGYARMPECSSRTAGSWQLD